MFYGISNLVHYLLINPVYIYIYIYIYIWMCFTAHQTLQMNSLLVTIFKQARFPLFGHSKIFSSIGMPILSNSIQYYSFVCTQSNGSKYC